MGSNQYQRTFDSTKETQDVEPRSRNKQNMPTSSITCFAIATISDLWRIRVLFRQWATIERWLSLELGGQTSGSARGEIEADAHPEIRATLGCSHNISKAPGAGPGEAFANPKAANRSTTISFYLKSLEGKQKQPRGRSHNLCIHTCIYIYMRV